MKITVIWMNGQKETHQPKEWRITENHLWLEPEISVTGRADQKPAVLVPLNNTMKVEFGE
jgi:hypothetical protein